MCAPRSQNSWGHANGFIIVLIYTVRFKKRRGVSLVRLVSVRSAGIRFAVDCAARVHAGGARSSAKTCRHCPRPAGAFMRARANAYATLFRGIINKYFVVNNTLCARRGNRRMVRKENEKKKPIVCTLKKKKTVKPTAVTT